MLKCPTCESTDHCKFVFVEHQLNNGVKETSNPSDYHFLFICPNLHLFDADGKEVELIANKLIK